MIRSPFSPISIGWQKVKSPSTSPARRFTYRRLIEMIGESAAEQLARQWGGRRLPRLPQFHVERRERNRRIRAALDAGQSYRQVATRAALSSSQIERIGHVAE